MSAMTTEFAWVDYYRQVAEKLLAWNPADRSENLRKLLLDWVGEDFTNPMPSYVFSELSTPKTYEARAKKAEALSALLGLADWPADYAGVPGAYAGSAFLLNPPPTVSLDKADWRLMEESLKPDVLQNAESFKDALQAVFYGLALLGRSKDNVEVTKFVSSMNPKLFLPLDANNRRQLLEDGRFTAGELHAASETAQGYVAFIRKWHRVYPSLCPLVFNHHAWEKALGLPLTEDAAAKT